MLLDETKFFHLLLERKLEDKYTQFMLGAQTDLYRFLTAECCLSLNDIRAVSRYSIAAADALDAEHSLKEINAFVRGADGRVYVPGSSVKVRSVPRFLLIGFFRTILRILRLAIRARAFRKGHISIR